MPDARRHAQLGDTPAGSVPFQPGPTMAKLPPLPPTVREPGACGNVVPGVDELHDPEAVAHLGNGQHHRPLRKIELRERVERIDVEADDGLVRRVGELAVVGELVDRRRAPSGFATWVTMSICISM